MPRFAIWPITALATIALLYVAKPILAPIIFAVLLAQLLAPGVRRLERFMTPVLAALVAVLLIGALIFGLVALVSNQLASFEDILPKLQERLAQVFGELGHQIAKTIDLPTKAQENLVHKGLESSFSAGGAVAVTLSALSFTVSTLAEVALVGILAFLMLYYRNHFRRQLLTIAPILERTSAMGQSYVAGLGLVMALVGTADALGFFLVGAPFPVLFGLLGASAVLIPYVGIAVVAPLCVALTWVSTGSAAVAGGVALVYTIVHFLEGNVISPYVVGNKVNLNPLATILAVLVGGELWGPAGMCLFIPLVGMLKLVLDAWPAAEPYARMLGTISADERKQGLRRIFVGKIKGRVRGGAGVVSPPLSAP